MSTCVWEEFGNTIWYRFASEEATSITMWINSAPYDESSLCTRGRCSMR